MSRARAGPGAGAGAGLLCPDDRQLLLELLGLPTAGPLEGDDAPRLWEAQRAYAAAAARLGFEVAHHASADPEVLQRPDVPVPVRRAAARMGSAYLSRQPNLVLRLGRRRERAATVMFNVHLDTVADAPPPAFRDGRFIGRGAIDAKGPAVALLAGVRAAIADRPELPGELCVLIQAVAGEEGGAMGVHGTRPLVEADWIGALNVFCEPTGLRFLDRSTAAMTARISVHGRDACDDQPAAGHNATVLLGYLAARLGRRLGELVGAAGGRLCVAGLETGPLHNRVYGSGRLLLNVAYGSMEAAAVIERLVEDAVDEGVRQFSRRYGGVGELARTAADAAEVTRLEWDKRGLPALRNRDAELEALLQRRALVPRQDDQALAKAFTCDAIWMQPAGAFAIVLGPGTLDVNRAHADGEFAELAELERFAAAVSRILLALAERKERIA